MRRVASTTFLSGGSSIFMRPFCTAARSVLWRTSATPTRRRPSLLHARMCHLHTSIRFASGSATDAGVGIAPELMKELHELLRTHPAGTWFCISELYDCLSITSRRKHVRPHKTLRHVLVRAQDDLHISIDPAGVMVAVGCNVAPPPSTMSADAPAPPTSSSPPKATVVQPEPSHETCTSPAPARDVEYPRTDFFFDVGRLASLPPAPADFDVSPSARAAPRGREDGSVLSLRSFLHFIPPFFVPMEEVLAQMPGYTEAHMVSYFATKAMEVVKVGRRSFVRLFGGYAAVDLDGCEVAEETFAAYRPDPTLANNFVPHFEGRHGEWMPLEMLLKRADPAHVAELPYHGIEAILYFAQMQHIFAFSVEARPTEHGGGDDHHVGHEGVEKDDQSWSCAVLLRPTNFGGLEMHTSPTPRSSNWILQHVPLEGSVDVAEVERRLPDVVRAEVVAYFGNLQNYFAAHGPVFFLSDDATVVMRTSYRRRQHVSSLSLEEQLVIATRERKKRQVRTLRRRMAFRDDPSHPFHDPENLAREVARHLPRRGFTQQKVFLRALPEELLHFLPIKMHNFFQSHPTLFQHFELQRAGNWCLSRPDQPLPRGVLRSTFDEAEVVRLIAAYLQGRGGHSSCSTIHLHLPRGAQDMIRKRWGGIFYLLEKHSEYFSMVLSQDAKGTNSVSSAVVHLIRLPNVSGAEEEDVVDGGGGDGDGDGDDDGTTRHGDAQTSH